MASIFTYGQVNIAVDTDKKDLTGKEPFILTIIQEINGNELIQESPLLMPDLSKFNKVAEGSVRNTLVDPQTKTVINQLVYEYVLEPKQPGRFLIGSVLVKVNGRIYKSEPFYLNVKEGDFAKNKNSENTSEDVYLNMEIKEREVYENQPTIAVIRAYSKNFNNLRRVGRVSFSNHSNLDIKPVSLAKSEIHQNDNVSSQVIAVVMVFPNAAGKIIVPPATVAYNEEGRRVEKLKTNGAKLNVKKLPTGSPENFKNAVGKFDIAIAKVSPSQKVELNKPIDVVVKLKGQGNLNSTQLPKLLRSADYKIYKPEITSKITGGEKGMKGEVLAHYIVIPKKPGNISINTEAFAFFSLEEKKYVNLGVQSLVVEVLTPDQIADAKTTLEKVNEYTNNVLETVNTPIIETQAYKIQDETKFNWKALLTNYSLIALFLGLLIFGISSLKKMNNLKPRTEKVSLGTVAETEAEIRQNHVFDFNSDIRFLENKVSEGNFSEFFNGFESFKKDAEDQVYINTNLSLVDYFMQQKGQQFAEDYRTLLHQIQIEKYSPAHTKEHISELLSETKRIFSQII